MSLFKQEINVSLKDTDNLIEKVVTKPITKKTISLSVAPGTIAYIGGERFEGNVEVDASDVAGRKAPLTIYLTPDRLFDKFNVDFFGGQHTVSLSNKKEVKIKFAIVGTASIEIASFKKLADHYNKTISKVDLTNDIIENFRNFLTSDVSAAASKFITEDTTELNLQSSLGKIVEDALLNERKSQVALGNMGLMISLSGVSLRLNTIEDTDEIIKKINGAIVDGALFDIKKPELITNEQIKDSETKRKTDLIKAGNAKVTESTENINKTVTTNTNGTAVKEEEKKTANPGKFFCPNCGCEITSNTAKFCSKCGAKLDR